MAQSKDQNKSPETNSEGTEIYELLDKEWKIIIFKMLNEPKEHRKLSQIMK